MFPCDFYVHYGMVSYQCYASTFDHGHATLTYKQACHDCRKPSHCVIAIILPLWHLIHWASHTMPIRPWRKMFTVLEMTSWTVGSINLASLAVNTGKSVFSSVLWSTYCLHSCHNYLVLKGIHCFRCSCFSSSIISSRACMWMMVGLLVQLIQRWFGFLLLPLQN